MDTKWDDFEEFNIPHVEEWPEGLQELVDMELVKVEYRDNIPYFSLTEKGKQIHNATDPDLN